MKHILLWIPLFSMNNTFWLNIELITLPSLIGLWLNCSDGSYYRSARKQHHLHSKQMRESASHNRDPHMHTTIIPRTQRIPRENVISSTSPMNLKFNHFVVICSSVAAGEAEWLCQDPDWQAGARTKSQRAARQTRKKIDGGLQFISNTHLSENFTELLLRCRMNVEAKKWWPAVTWLAVGFSQKPSKKDCKYLKQWRRPLKIDWISLMIVTKPF